MEIEEKLLIVIVSLFLIAMFNKVLIMSNNLTTEKLYATFFSESKRVGLDERANKDYTTYQALTCYRTYGSLKEFFKVNPEMLHHKAHLTKLWKEFDKLNDKQLADLAIELMKEI